MLVPVSWLKTYIPSTKADPQEIARHLTMVGLEVEALTCVRPGFTGVVTARVEAVEKHPNADKLSVCQVNDGTTVVPVVCGAPNVAPGITIAFAKPGAQLPGDFKIKVSKIRGVTSNGMICSARELELGGDGEGIMHLATDLALNLPFEDVLGLVEWVMDVNITANRPDCLSMIGVARELATSLGEPLVIPPATVTESGPPVASALTVNLEAVEGCPRYCARRVTGLKVGPSPDWMRRRLERAGVRPINNVVDVTNYVMLETGHPMHAFDAVQVRRNTIVARWARAGEALLTLDGVYRVLTTTDVVIADGERVVALGGIMGGEHSGVTEATTEVVLEAAFFDPVVIRKTARRLNLHSESSHRFERGCDPTAPPRVLDRACQLLAEIAGGQTAPGTVDAYPTPIEPRTIPVRTSRINHLLGTQLERHKIERLLARLGLVVDEYIDGNLYYDPDRLVVKAPSFRPDLTSEVDVIEEVARLHGYENIPSTWLALPSTPVRVDPLVVASRHVRHALTGQGFNEVLTPAFSAGTAPDAVRLTNPMREDESTLRRSVLETLLRVVEHNLNHQNTVFDVFEIARAFATTEAGHGQEYRVALISVGTAVGHWRQSQRSLEYYDAKSVVDLLLDGLGYSWEPRALDVAVDGAATLPVELFHPARSALVVVDGLCVGLCGELHPTKVGSLKVTSAPVAVELSLERLLERARRGQSLAPLAAFPRADRDVAVIVPADVTYAALKSAADEIGGKLLESSRVFDVFSGGSIEAGKKSVALALSFRHPERTLTDVEVDKGVQRIVGRLQKDFGAVLRER